MTSIVGFFLPDIHITRLASLAILLRTDYRQSLCKIPEKKSLARTRSDIFHIRELAAMSINLEGGR